MELIVYLIVLAVSGLFIGALGRFAIPGRDPMSLLQTMFVGIAGSLAAGLIAWYLLDHSGAGILLSVACSAAIVYVIRRMRGGSLTRPGRA